MNEGFLIIIACAALAWLWYSSRAAHEKVLNLSARVCRQINVQRLDDTVALRRLRIAWTQRGPVLRRLYGFDFSSDGLGRSHGNIALIGLRLDWISVEGPSGREFIDIR